MQCIQSCSNTPGKNAVNAFRNEDSFFFFGVQTGMRLQPHLVFCFWKSSLHTPCVHSNLDGFFSFNGQILKKTLIPRRWLKLCSLTAVSLGLGRPEGHVPGGQFLVCREKRQIKGERIGSRENTRERNSATAIHDIQKSSSKTWTGSGPEHLEEAGKDLLVYDSCSLSSLPPLAHRGEKLTGYKTFKNPAHSSSKTAPKNHLGGWECGGGSS